MFYEALIVVHPTENERADGKLEDVVTGVEIIPASSVESVRIQMLRKFSYKVPASAEDAQIEVLVRPFEGRGIGWGTLSCVNT